MDAKAFRVANLFFLPLPGLRSADVHRTILSVYPLVHRISYLNSLLPWGENSLYQSFYSIPGFPAIPTDHKPDTNIQKVAYHQQSKIRNDVFDDGDRHVLRLRSAKLLTPS